MGRVPRVSHSTREEQKRKSLSACTAENRSHKRIYLARYAAGCPRHARRVKLSFIKKVNYKLCSYGHIRKTKRKSTTHSCAAIAPRRAPRLNQVQADFGLRSIEQCYDPFRQLFTGMRECVLCRRGLTRSCASAGGNIGKMVVKVSEPATQRSKL